MNESRANRDRRCAGAGAGNGAAAVNAVDVTTALRLYIHTSSREVGPCPLRSPTERVGTSRTHPAAMPRASSKGQRSGCSPALGNLVTYVDIA